MNIQAIADELIDGFMGLTTFWENYECMPAEKQKNIRDILVELTKSSALRAAIYPRSPVYQKMLRECAEMSLNRFHIKEASQSHIRIYRKYFNISAEIEIYLAHNGAKVYELLRNVDLDIERYFDNKSEQMIIPIDEALTLLSEIDIDKAVQCCERILLSSSVSEKLIEKLVYIIYERYKSDTPEVLSNLVRQNKSIMSIIKTSLLRLPYGNELMMSYIQNLD